MSDERMVGAERGLFVDNLEVQQEEDKIRTE